MVLCLKNKTDILTSQYLQVGGEMTIVVCWEFEVFLSKINRTDFLNKETKGVKFPNWQEITYHKTIWSYCRKRSGSAASATRQSSFRHQSAQERMAGSWIAIQGSRQKTIHRKLHKQSKFTMKTMYFI